MSVKDGSINKIEEIYLYVIKNSQSNVNFGSTLFNKILYFSDFDFYERNGRSISGDLYVRREHGPTAKSFVKVINRLKRLGLIDEYKRERSRDHQQTRYILLEGFEPGLLGPEEIKELDRNISRLGGMTARQVSEYSHYDMPYKATKDGDIISYGLVHYRNPIYSALDSIE